MDDAIKIEFERIHDEDKRQNKRLDSLEESVKEIHQLSRSVDKLAINMEGMLKELQRQNTMLTDQSDRIKELENRPAQNWNTMTRTIFTTIVGAIAGGLVVFLIQGLAGVIH